MRTIWPAPKGMRSWSTSLFVHLAGVCRFESRSTSLVPALLQAMVAAASMSLPMIFSALTDRLNLGSIMALGALSATHLGAGKQGTPAWQAAFQAFLPAGVAALLASLLGETGAQREYVILGIVGMSALLMRYSRPVAVTVVRFILFLVIYSAAISESLASWRLAALILLGALWTALLAGTAAFAISTPSQRIVHTDSTFSARLQRMRSELALLQTWDFPMRLVLGLGLSLLIRQLYPAHHYSWISIAVALLTPRHFEMWPVKATQRFLGTLLGVALAGMLLLPHPTATFLIVTLAVLAGLRSWYEERSYMAYSVVMAPLILCLMSVSQMATGPLLLDRVASTLIAVLLVYVSNWVAYFTTAKGLRRSPLPTSSFKHPLSQIALQFSDDSAQAPRPFP